MTPPPASAVMQMRLPQMPLLPRNTINTCTPFRCWGSDLNLEGELCEDVLAVGR